MTERNPLLTTKAFKTSLSPPRVPPFGSIHRCLYTSNAKNDVKTGGPSIHYHVDRGSTRSDEEKDHESIPHLIRIKLLSSARNNIAHPHMARSSPDASTRYIGSKLMSISYMNHCRDSGLFRRITDALVAGTAAPLLAVSSPYDAIKFLRLTRQRETLRYGPHDRQFVDIWEPFSQTRRLVVFFHGGAWGSGHSWMYRLIAAPFLDQGFAVGICSYRVYPDGRVQEQMEDLNAALQLLLSRFADVHVTLSGHSSGAHVALLWLVRNRLFDEKGIFLSVDSFMGLSGPYDISHHFDYEAGRGVEELSPLKPVNGHNRRAFQYNSPAQWLLRSLGKQDPRWWRTRNLLPRIVLFHGIEDDTVPFTATAEAARVLMACGIPVEQVYLEKTGHQDVPVQLMVGGRTRQAVIEWIEKLEAKCPGQRLNFHQTSKL